MSRVLYNSMYIVCLRREHWMESDHPTRPSVGDWRWRPGKPSNPALSGVKKEIGVKRGRRMQED